MSSESASRIQGPGTWAKRPSGPAAKSVPVWPAIHLTAEGYGVLAEAQFDAFYAGRLLPEALPVPTLSWPMQGLLIALVLATSRAGRGGSRPR